VMGGGGQRWGWRRAGDRRPPSHPVCRVAGPRGPEDGWSRLLPPVTSTGRC